MAEIALVNANIIKPAVAPLGLEYLAKACRDAGIDAEVIDLSFEDDPHEALRRRLAEVRPELVGVTVRNSDNCYLLSSHSFIPEIREVVARTRSATEAPVVLGGAGFSAAPRAAMRAIGADYGVAGDGERALVALLEVVRGRREPGEVPGLLWREGGAVRAAEPEWTAFADGPLPRDAVELERYLREGGQVGLETKRGCDRSCIYCADPLSKGRRIRERPPAAVADEVEHLLARGCDVYHICDSEFNIPESHARAVCEELIGRGLGDRIRWYAYLAPAPFSDELAGLMRRAGCRGIDFGADSGDPEMLRRLGRDFEPEDTRAAVAACRTQGIAVMTDLLIGAPGETRESARASIEMARQAEPSCAGISLGVRVYPGTGIAGIVREQGPMADNPALWGRTAENEEMLEPVFYLAPELGAPEEAAAWLADVIGGDPRFFFGGSGDDADYDYDDNELLVRAIAEGARGAYWDILRRRTAGEDG